MTDQSVFMTAGGVQVMRTTTSLPADTALEDIRLALDSRRGVLLGSSYEYPGRYRRWSLGFTDPPLALTARGRTLVVEALNARGQVLIPAITSVLQSEPHHTVEVADRRAVTVQVAALPDGFDESQRTRQPSAMSTVRALLNWLASDQDSVLGVYGAFAFDLVHQIEPVAQRRPRPADQRDIVVYVPDRVVVLDHYRGRALRHDYEFVVGDLSTAGLAREGAVNPPSPPPNSATIRADHAPGGYAALVALAMPHFARGDLFEVVPSTSHHRPVAAPPSRLFATLRDVNPSPYGFLINLGQDEWLIGASPEMFVRVEGRRMETCPISGTIARGRDAVEDAEQIRTLLNSAKDEAELTMCTDVDRNDKARIAEPGSVRVIGRRQIELYSHLIHTVDHVEGRIGAGFDGIDAFLTHLWAVTVTGAPKPAALAFLEEHETTARRWYGGAVGWFGINGDVNTGLTLRTMRLAGGIAEVRVGATVLADSDPSAEEAETLVKAAALFRTIERADAPPAPRATAAGNTLPGTGRRVLFVDCEDSFVHTLASYLRATGAEVTVLRPAAARRVLDRNWDLVALSPGPGRPERFGLPQLVRDIVALELPLFGVCLGLQAIAEAFGAPVQQMDAPQHGRPARLAIRDRSGLFAAAPDGMTVGRYHSLHVPEAALPAEFAVTATTDASDGQGVVMAIEHRTRPISAVQFHPESIMSAGGEAGFLLLRTMIERLPPPRGTAGPDRRQTGQVAIKSAAE
ncbi:MAG: anthranilate synthase component I [Alphaproteobacteria bacterium]|nr:MAG: anthranilate synthase component I [Alphaproteobacteria bacterium]